MKEVILHGDVAGSTNYVITATNEAPGGAAANAGTDIVKNKVISTGTGNWYLTFTGLSALPIKAISLMNLNTNNWTTIRAQASNDNFATAPAATVDLAIKTRVLWDFSETVNRVVASNRHDAFAFVDWNYKDYRILLNSNGVIRYEVGRAYFASGSTTLERGPEIQGSADVVTVSETISGGAGQNIMIPQYQQFNYSMDFRLIDKVQADFLTRRVSMNPTCCYFIGGADQGELLFGNFTFQERETFGPVFGPDKIILSGRFTESL